MYNLLYMSKKKNRVIHTQKPIKTRVFNVSYTPFPHGYPLFRLKSPLYKKYILIAFSSE